MVVIEYSLSFRFPTFSFPAFPFVLVKGAIFFPVGKGGKDKYGDLCDGVSCFGMLERYAWFFFSVRVLSLVFSLFPLSRQGKGSFQGFFFGRLCFCPLLFDTRCIYVKIEECCYNIYTVSR